MADNVNPQSALDRLNDRTVNRMPRTNLDPYGNLSDQYQSVSRMESMRRSALRMYGFGESAFGNPFVQGAGLPLNPFSIQSTLGNAIGTSVSYQSLTAQSQAFFGAGNFSVKGIEDFSNALNAIGRSKSDVISVMQQMATLSRQVSSGMADASMSVLNFAKANGLNANVVAGAVGTAATASNMTLTGATANQYAENIRKLGGGVNARFEPTAAAVQSFTEMGLQSGFATRMDGNQVTGGMNMLAGFQALNPTLYNGRPDVAVRHTGQMVGMGSSLLLGMAMDVAGKNNMPTDILSVMAAMRDPARQQTMIGGLAQMVGKDRGLLEMLAMSGVDPGFLEQLRDNPSALQTKFKPGGGRSPEENATAGAAASTEVEQAVATIMNNLQTTTGIIKEAVDKFATEVAKIPIGVLVGGQVIMSGTNMALGNRTGSEGSPGGGTVVDDIALYEGLKQGGRRFGPTIWRGAKSIFQKYPGVTIGVGLAAGIGSLAYYYSEEAETERANNGIKGVRLTGMQEDDLDRFNRVNDYVKNMSEGRFDLRATGYVRTQAEQDAARAKNEAAGVMDSAPIGSRNTHADGNAVDFQVFDSQTGEMTQDPVQLARAQAMLKAQFPDATILTHGSASGTPHIHVEGLKRAMEEAAKQTTTFADSLNKANAAAAAPRPRPPMR